MLSLSSLASSCRISNGPNNACRLGYVTARSVLRGPSNVEFHVLIGPSKGGRCIVASSSLGRASQSALPRYFSASTKKSEPPLIWESDKHANMEGPVEERFKLPPQRSEDEGKLSVFMNIDYTLVCPVILEEIGIPKRAFVAEFPRKPEHTVTIKTPDNKEYTAKIFERPWLANFLSQMAVFCEPILFTSSTPEYARAVLSCIDPNNLIKTRLYRHARSPEKHKNIAISGRDLKRSVLIDASERALKGSPLNGIQIYEYRFEQDPDCKDDRLKHLFKLLKKLSTKKDVPAFLKKYPPHDRFHLLETVQQKHERIMAESAKYAGGNYSSFDFD